jgi:hypothetical protein
MNVANSRRAELKSNREGNGRAVHLMVAFVRMEYYDDYNIREKRGEMQI